MSPPAQAQRPRDEIYQSFERVGEAAARVASVFCTSDQARLLQGALDGVNAMPERGGETPLLMQTSGIEDFSKAYSDLLESGVDRVAVEAAAINGIVHAFDTTGDYRTSDSVHRPTDGSVALTLDGSGPAPIVISTIPDGPAARANIQSGDHLVAIDGHPVEGMRLHEVIRTLQGPIGATVSLTLERSGTPFTTSIERVRVTRASVTWRVTDNIGVITVETFSEHTGRRVRDAIRAIRRDLRQPAGFIVDLRDNSGGLLDQVIETADQFVDGGPVMSVRSFGDCRPGDTQNYNARRHDETGGARLVVITNANTASGAEMLAAALRELRGATLVGQPSVGNSRVHTVIPLQGGRDGFLKLSTGILRTPSGSTWDGTGLAPDIVTQPRNGDTDPALEQAIATLQATP